MIDIVEVSYRVDSVDVVASSSTVCSANSRHKVV
jgi:hypothetical protein